MPRLLKKILSEVLTETETSKIYSAFDIIGDIVIIKVPDCLLTKKEVIAKSILQHVKSARSVFVQTSSVRGSYRIRNLEFLAGVYNTLTEYREHGCRFKVDINKTYFSPRLSTERLRIAKMVSNDEVITNMFAGVGTYSIVIAKLKKNSKIYSIDLNPIANELCVANIQLNKVQDRVFPICGDAREIITNQIKGKSDRVIMPLPERAKEFVDSAVLALKEKEGFVHYFAHISAHTKKLAVEQGMTDTEDAFRDYQHKILATRVIREVGPRLYQIVSDVYVNNNGK
jgi:tRNA (guanine37-N1)-methyltransferase